MFDVGLGELLILAVLALFVFGPDKLPKVAAEAGAWVRRIREYATKAQSDLKESAGVDVASVTEDLQSLRDLHPKRIISSALTDPSASGAAAKSTGPASTNGAATNGAATNGAATNGAARPGHSSPGGAAAPNPGSGAPGDAAGAPEGVASRGPAFDPDAT